MKRICILTLCAAVILTAALPVCYAADLYPSGISVSEDKNIITKIYELDAGDDPADIPTADFERGGYLYFFVDMTRTRKTAADTREHTETVSLPCSSGNMADALKLFETALDYEDADGYTGALALDHTTVQVNADGYSTRNYTVTATRTYPNLSAADVSLVPKTTEEKGRVLQLENVTWETAHTGSIDSYDMPERYTATATYTGRASSRSVTGYTATADYTGEIVKEIPGPVIYTAIFEGAEIVPPTPEPEPAPEPENSLGILAPVLSVMGTLAVIAVLWYAGPRLIRRWKAGRGS